MFHAVSIGIKIGFLNLTLVELFKNKDSFLLCIANYIKTDHSVANYNRYNLFQIVYFELIFFETHSKQESPDF